MSKSKSKPYIYATIENVDFKDQTLTLSRKVLKGWDETGSRTGKVTKIGAGQFKAERLFGSYLTKTFTIKSSDGFITNEVGILSKAMHWAIAGYDSISPSMSKETRNKYEKIVNYT